MSKKSVLTAALIACFFAVEAVAAEEAVPGESLSRALAQANAPIQSKVGTSITIPADKLFDGDTFPEQAMVSTSRPGSINDKGDLIIDGASSGIYDVKVDVRIGKFVLAEKTIKVEFADGKK
jgi:hypothetical protein